MTSTRLATTAWLPLAAVALGLGALLASGAWYPLDAVSDVPLFLAYGARWLAGGVPYRDFAVEYPPLALPLFALPAALGTGLAAVRAFQLEMLACLGGAALAITAAARRAPDAAAPRDAALAFAAGCGLLGAISVNRFDAAVALLLALALLALSAGRHAAAAALLGLGAALKLSPAALLPLVLLLAPDGRTRRRSAAAFALAAAVPFVPALLAAPGGVAALFGFHLARPLQLESVLAAPFLAAHLASGLPLAIASGHGSQNLASPAADLAARLGGALTLAALALALGLAWRARAALRSDPGAAALAALALLLALVATGKVLSPQYLTWLLPPLALLGARRRGLAGLVALALLTTQAYFPARYWALVALDGGTVALLLLRNGLLVAALIVALRQLARLGPPVRTPRAAAP